VAGNEGSPRENAENAKAERFSRGAAEKAEKICWGRRVNHEEHEGGRVINDAVGIKSGRGGRVCHEGHEGREGFLHVTRSFASFAFLASWRESLISRKGAKSAKRSPQAEPLHQIQKRDKHMQAAPSS
jgi:hypothetical protein